MYLQCRCRRCFESKPVINGSFQSMPFIDGDYCVFEVVRLRDWLFIGTIQNGLFLIRSRRVRHRVWKTHPRVWKTHPRLTTFQYIFDTGLITQDSLAMPAEKFYILYSITRHDTKPRFEVFTSILLSLRCPGEEIHASGVDSNHMTCSSLLLAHKTE